MSLPFPNIPPLPPTPHITTPALPSMPGEVVRVQDTAVAIYNTGETSSTEITIVKDNTRYWYIFSLVGGIVYLGNLVIPWLTLALSNTAKPAVPASNSPLPSIPSNPSTSPLPSDVQNGLQFLIFLLAVYTIANIAVGVLSPIFAILGIFKHRTWEAVTLIILGIIGAAIYAFQFGIFNRFAVALSGSGLSGIDPGLGVYLGLFSSLAILLGGCLPLLLADYSYLYRRDPSLRRGIEWYGILIWTLFALVVIGILVVLMFKV